jgi:hypothetical protein
VKQGLNQSLGLWAIGSSVGGIVILSCCGCFIQIDSAN